MLKSTVRVLYVQLYSEFTSQPHVPCYIPSLHSLIDERLGDNLCVSRGKRPCNLRSESDVLLRKTYVEEE